MSTGFAPSAWPQVAGLPPLVVYIRGEHDCSTVEALSVVFAAALEDGKFPVVIDLSEVTFMDTSTVHLLQRTRDYLGERNRSLVLRRPSRSAARILSVCETIWSVGFVIEHELPQDVAPANLPVGDAEGL